MFGVLLLRQPVNVGYFSKLPAAPTATPHLHPLFAPPCSDCQVKRVRPAGTMAVVITQFTTPKSCLPACMSNPPPHLLSSPSWDAGNGCQTRRGAVCPLRLGRGVLAACSPLKFLRKMTEIRIIFRQASCLCFSAESPRLHGCVDASLTPPPQGAE